MARYGKSKKDPNEPTNRKRAAWAKNALAVFTEETFGGREPDTMHPEDLECAVKDLITDLLHFAKTKRMDAVCLHASALFMFEAELIDES